MNVFCRSMVVAVACLLVACQPSAPVTEEAQEVTVLEDGSFTAELNGFDIHYEVHGQGPVLMTVPNSWGLSLEGLRAMYRPLEERVTMVYFDPRGMGESAAIREEADMGMAAVRADFDALRQHLGLETVNAIGWSNGASNLIYLAAEYPDALESAVFLHGAASFTEEDFAVWAQQHPELMQEYLRFQQEVEANDEIPPEEKTALMKEFWLDGFFVASSADKEAAPAMLHSVFDEAEFSWPHADYANRESPTFDARDQLPAITARCLVIAGAHDMFPTEKARELHDGLADSQFMVFESSGHFSPKEETEAFKTAIWDFLGAG